MFLLAVAVASENLVASLRLAVVSSAEAAPSALPAAIPSIVVDISSRDFVVLPTARSNSSLEFEIVPADKETSLIINWSLSIN